MRHARRATWTFLGVVGTVVLGGCSGESKKTGMPFDEVPTAIASAACEAYEACYGAVFELFLNGSDCTELTTKRLENGSFGEVGAAIERGTVRYDGTKVGDCLNAMRGQSCAEILERDKPECREALDGLVRLGGDCELNEECEGDAICDASAETCPGQCAARRNAGQTCSFDDECVDGLVCSEETELCVAPASEGDACEFGAPPCGPGLLCLGQDEVGKRSGTCRNVEQAMRVKAGEACSVLDGTLCEVGNACVADQIDLTSLSISWLCVKMGTYNAGATCKPGFPDACAEGFYCKRDAAGSVLDGVCTAVPDAKEPCGTGFSRQCKTGATCVTGICQNYADNGNGCTGDAMCYSEYCGSSGGCEPQLPCE